MSVVGAHSVGREWAGLILAIFWVRDDPGDPLGRRVPPVLSHLGSVGTARPLGWSLGGLLRSCPPEPMFLLCGVIPRFPCVALVSRTALLVRGVLPRSDRRHPVTLAGVMRWCAEATIITARGGSLCGRPSRCVAGPACAVLSPCQGILLANLLPQDMESRRLGACTGPILAGTPVRRRGVLGAHVPGRRHGSDPGR